MVMGVGPDQNTVLPDFFFASKKSSLDNENWKSLITESNKKKAKNTRSYNFVKFFIPQKEETRNDIEKKAKNK